MKERAIDWVVCRYCGKYLDMRDDRIPIYRVTLGYMSFIYCCYDCVEKNKKDKGGKDKWLNGIK